MRWKTVPRLVPIFFDLLDMSALFTFNVTGILELNFSNVTLCFYWHVSAWYNLLFHIITVGKWTEPRHGLLPLLYLW